MRRLGCLLALLALGLAGCGGTTKPSSGAADFVPASVPLFVAIDTDLGSSQWQTVNELANKFPDKQKAIDSIKQQLTKNGLDWEEDLKPALGPELDVVMLDFAHPDETVALMQPKNQGAFEGAVRKGNAADPRTSSSTSSSTGGRSYPTSRPRLTPSCRRATPRSARSPRTRPSQTRWTRPVTGSSART
jgi:hypothetical protein